MEIYDGTKLEKRLLRLVDILQGFYSTNQFQYVHNRAQNTVLYHVKHGALVPANGSEKFSTINQIFINHLNSKHWLRESLVTFSSKAAIICNIILSLDQNRPVNPPRQVYRIGKYNVDFENLDELKVTLATDEPDRLVGHYIDAPDLEIPHGGDLNICGPSDFACPEIDSILTTQKWDVMTREWFFAFMGRMMFPVRGDLWDRSPFLLGRPGTGKTTIAGSVIGDMWFPAERVNVFSCMNDNFSLAPFHVPNDIWLNRFAEVDDSWNFPRPILNAFLEHDRIKVKVKNVNDLPATAIKTHSIADGNEFWNFKSHNDSVLRRYIVFLFNEIPRAPDASLKVGARRHAGEFLLRCILAYRDMLYHIGADTPLRMELLPPQIKQAMKAAIPENSAIKTFERNYEIVECDITRPETRFNVRTVADFNRDWEVYCLDHGLPPPNRSNKRVVKEFDELLRVYNLVNTFPGLSAHRFRCQYLFPRSLNLTVRRKSE